VTPKPITQNTLFCGDNLPILRYVWSAKLPTSSNATVATTPNFG
jgi:hypothetical protein